MNWAQTIWNMHYLERKSIAEIIKYFDTPVVNEQFVQTIIENVKFLKTAPVRRGWKNVYKNKRPPLPGTMARVVWEKVQSLGGKDAFIELRKTKTLTQLAIDWGVKKFHLTNYVRDFINGRTDEARFRPMVRSERQRRINLGRKRPMKKGNLKNLW